MERDFMGITGNNLGSRKDSVFGGNPAMQWLSSNKISALPQFMSYKAGLEERAKNLVIDQFFSPAFKPITTNDAFQANYKKCFALGSQGDQFPMHGYRSQSNISSGAPMHHFNEAKSSPMVMHHPNPVATRSPFFKVDRSPNDPNLTITSLKQQAVGGGVGSNGPAAGSIVGAFTPRNVSKPLPTTAQLTIFYAGSVNVYDNVPLDKAQSIMFLASKGYNASSNAVNQRPEAPVKVTGVDGLSMNQTQIQNQNHIASHWSGGGSIATDDLSGSKSGGSSMPKNQNEQLNNVTTTVSVMSRAIPQARKASLTRFLEKRKERVINAAPYASAKNPWENTVGTDGTSGKSSSVNIALSIICEEPSTKLEM